MADSAQNNSESIAETVKIIKKMSSLVPEAKQDMKGQHSKKRRNPLKKIEKRKKEKKSKKKEPEVKILPIKKTTLVTSKEKAVDFAQKVHKRFNVLIKASILFGSQATSTAEPLSDIDIILIIDDASINWDLELIAWYREELGRLIAAQEYHEEIHINTIKLTTWWNDLMHGDPVVLNILRYGEALIDVGGFFNPLKALLLQGRITSSPEAVYNALERAPSHLARSKLSILNCVEGIYWTMVDAAQAALITAGKLPPSPEHLPQMLKETFVDNGLMKIERARQLREIYNFHKGISHKEIHQIKGTEIDHWQEIAESFLLEITRLIDKLLESKKST